MGFRAHQSTVKITVQSTVKIKVQMSLHFTAFAYYIPYEHIIAQLWRMGELHMLVFSLKIESKGCVEDEKNWIL